MKTTQGYHQDFTFPTSICFVPMNIDPCTNSLILLVVTGILKTDHILETQIMKYLMQCVTLVEIQTFSTKVIALS